MGSTELQKRLQKLLPFLGKLTASSAVALVVLATIDVTITNAGTSGVSVALISLLSSVFGDVVAAPVIEQLMSGKLKEDDLEGQLQRFSELLEQQIEVSEEIRQMVKYQNSFAAVVGTALEINQNEIVKRVLRGVSYHQKLGADEILQQIAFEYESVLQRVDPEVGYLLRLIRQVKRGGVLAGFVASPIWADQNATTPKGLLSEHLKLPTVFTAFEQQLKRNPNQPSSDPKEVKYSKLQEVIEVHPRFVLIGESGAGKTTALEAYVLDMALKRLEGDLVPLPLLINLGLWEQDQSFSTFIRQYLYFISNPIEQIASGDIFIYLDGLNEMGGLTAKHIDELRQWIGGAYAPRKVVIACTRAAYENNSLNRPSLRLELPVVRLDVLEESDIHKFVSNYLGDRAEGFLRQVDNSKRNQPETRTLTKLARNPFFLLALIMVYLHRENELPKNQGALFKEVVKLLWNRERERKTVLPLITYEDALSYLSNLAYHMMHSELPSSIPVTDTSNFVPSTSFLEAAQSANLVQIENGKLRFQHLLIQEYLAAEALKRIGFKLADLTLSSVSSMREKAIQSMPPEMREKMGNIVSIASYDRPNAHWDQVFVAYSGLLTQGKANNFVSQLIKANPWAAALCIASGVVSSRFLIGNVVHRLLEIDVIVQAAETGQVFVQLGKDVLPPLINELDSDNSDIRIAAAGYLATLANEEVLPALQNALEKAVKSRQPELYMQKLQGIIQLLIYRIQSGETIKNRLY